MSGHWYSTIIQAPAASFQSGERRSFPGHIPVLEGLRVGLQVKAKKLQGLRPEDPKRTGLRSRIRLGATVGAFVGGLYCLLAIVIMLLNGRSGGIVASLGEWARVSLAYMIGGTVAGAIVGIAAPLGRTLLGGALIGVVATIPLGIGFHLAVEGSSNVGPLQLGSILRFSLLVGPLYGAVGWFAVRSAKRADSDPEA